MNFVKKFIGLVFLLMLPSALLAQEMNCDSVSCDKCICCISIDPTPAGQMISHVHEKNEWMISFRTMTMAQDGLSGTNKTDMLALYGYSPNSMQMNMYMLMAMYGISSRLTVMGMLHYNSNYMEMTMKSGSSSHNHAMQTAGIGDVKLTALYALSKQPRYHFLVTAGISLPTGNINFTGSETDMLYPNTRYPNEMQTGSGSYEALPGLCLMQKLNRFTYSAQFASVLRLNYNSVGYKLGNEATLNAWAAYQLTPFLSSSVRIETKAMGTTNYLTKALPDANYDYAATTHSSGGQTVGAFVGINAKARKPVYNKFTFGMEYGLPVYQNLNGIQLKTKYQFNVSLAFRF